MSRRPAGKPEAARCNGMIILTGHTGSSVRRAPPLVAGHAYDAGQVRAKIPAMHTDPVWPPRQVPAVGRGFLLDGFKAAGLTKEEGKAADKALKSVFCAVHPVGRVAAEGIELFRSSHETWLGWHDPERSWPAKLRTGFSVAADLVDLAKATAPGINDNRFVRIFDHSVTLGDAMCQLLEVVIGEESSS